MFFSKKRNLWKEKRYAKDIAPDEIFLDSSNLPKFDTSQFEGRIERPIGKKTFLFVTIAFALIGLAFASRTGYLQIVRGEELRERSKDNNLRHIIRFPERGVIYDRNNIELAWNVQGSKETGLSRRKYTNASGLAHLLGFVDYPKKDESGIYYEYETRGVDGVEKSYDSIVGGKNGLKIVESDVFGEILSESVVRPSSDGEDLKLTIDHSVQQKMYELIQEVAREAKFQGGAGVIMDVNSGEVLAITSYPEFDPQIMADGADSEIIKQYNQDVRKPFLNRAVSGLYTPGSIIKPFIALAALKENVISPQKEILSTGSLSVPNPYNPEENTIFKDWKAHGWVDMRNAIAVSSNVYFYTIGGGFESQKGLGITKIEKYLKDFGFGDKTGVNLSVEGDGLVPNPRWKKKIFNDDWRLGDTYITSIGQFGFQITPIQAVRSTALIANKGKLLKPMIVSNQDPLVEREVDIREEYFNVIQSGMRLAVTEGTAKSLNFPYVEVAAKTGTAEVGALKESVNSWIVGYFPYDKPKYAFAVVMERRESPNPIGGLFVVTNLIDWMHQNTPLYLKN